MLRVEGKRLNYKGKKFSGVSPSHPVKRQQFLCEFIFAFRILFVFNISSLLVHSTSLSIFESDITCAQREPSFSLQYDQLL